MQKNTYQYKVICKKGDNGLGVANETIWQDISRKIVFRPLQPQRLGLIIVSPMVQGVDVRPISLTWNINYPPGCVVQLYYPASGVSEDVSELRRKERVFDDFPPLLRV
jgi:hypothetical protein